MKKKLKKNSLFVILGLILINFLFCNNFAFSQEEEEEIPEKLKYFKEKYEETFDGNFEKVWSTVLKFVEGNNCNILSEKVRQKDDGSQRGICQTELCIISQHKDSTFKAITKYALDPPFIRGGVWTSVRMQYKFIVNDLGNGKINVVLSGELSGFEDHVSFKAYFFNSNGLLEFLAFEKIREMLNS